jgi:hypothetical protein
MKIAAYSKTFLFLALVSIAGANAALASEPAGDAQQQARFLLGGRSIGASGASPRIALVSAVSPESFVVDAQEQGRSATVTVNTTRTKTVPDNARAGEGGVDMARRMILRSAS